MPLLYYSLLPMASRRRRASNSLPPISHKEPEKEPEPDPEDTPRRPQCSVSTTLPIDCASECSRAIAPISSLAHTLTTRPLARVCCAVCMGTINKAACGRCMHHFCYECLLSATRTARNEGRSPACPLCRQPLEFISKDAQYDELISMSIMHLEQAATEDVEQTFPVETADTVEVDFRTGEGSAGVCLQTCQGPGVRVSKVLINGRFYNAGFRPDDLILEINGHGCYDVESAVAVINREQAGRGRLLVRVLRECDKKCKRLSFRELELPRKVKPGTTAAKKLPALAANEHQADPGTWLEC